MQSSSRGLWNNVELCAGLFLCLAASGCFGNSNGYSGNFLVVSENPRLIRVVSWSGFGAAQPLEGQVSETAKRASFFPRLTTFPDGTTVKWVFEDDTDAEVHSQVIALKGVVPQGVDGVTKFRFGADGVWTVAFEPNN